MDRPEGYPEVGAREIDQPSSSGASFLDTKNDILISLPESGQLRRNYSDVGERYYKFQENVSKSSMDSRLLALIEFFKELYFRWPELFKKIFPKYSHPDQFLVEMPKKLKLVLSQVKSDETTGVRAMQRSLSIGSPRELKGDESEIRLDRFKIRTIDLDDDDDDVKQDQIKSGGSK